MISYLLLLSHRLLINPAKGKPLSSAVYQKIYPQTAVESSNPTIAQKTLVNPRRIQTNQKGMFMGKRLVDRGI